jgi:hypothetical protein
VSHRTPRRHPPRTDGGNHGEINGFLAWPWLGAAVLCVAGVSRRLFRSCLPGRRLFCRHLDGICALDLDLHGGCMAAYTRRFPRLAGTRRHRDGDQRHHRSGVELLFRRPDQARTVNRQHAAQRDGASDRRRARGIRRAARQNRGDRLERILRPHRHRNIAAGAMVGRAVRQFGIARRSRGIRSARAGAAFGERLVNHHQSALLQAPA